MPWIKIIPPEEASPELREVYEEYQARMGRPPSPVMQIMSLKPKALQAVSALSRVVTFGGSRLGRKREELISVVVSAINRCAY